MFRRITYLEGLVIILCRLTATYKANRLLKKRIRVFTSGSFLSISGSEHSRPLTAAVGVKQPLSMDASNGFSWHIAEKAFRPFSPASDVYTDLLEFSIDPILGGGGCHSPGNGTKWNQLLDICWI